MLCYITNRYCYYIVHLFIGVTQTLWAGLKKPTGGISSFQIDDGGRAQTGTVKDSDVLGGAGCIRIVFHKHDMICLHIFQQFDELM